MKVFISVFGRFHAFNLARELNDNNHLYKIFTTYPYYYLKKYGLKKEQVISYPVLELLSRLRRYIPKFFLNYYLEALYYVFDNLCTLYINKNIDIFIGWSGFSLKSIKKSKKLKIKTVLERGSASIDYQKKILVEEYKKYNCDINISDLFIKRELKEYKFTDFINVPSNFAKKTFKERFKKKIFINKYGVDTRQFRLIKKNNSKFIVLYSGGLTLQKGSHYLLKAILSPVRNVIKIAKEKYKTLYTTFFFVKFKKNIEIKKILEINEPAISSFKKPEFLTLSICDGMPKTSIPL